MTTPLLLIRSGIITQLAPLLTANGGPFNEVERAPFSATDSVEDVRDILAEKSARNNSAYLSLVDTQGLPDEEHAGPGASYHRDAFIRYAHLIGSARDNTETGSREALDSNAEKIVCESVMMQEPTGAPSGYGFDHVRLIGSSAVWRAESYIRVIDFTCRIRSICE